MWPQSRCSNFKAEVAAEEEEEEEEQQWVCIVGTGGLRGGLCAVLSWINSALSRDKRGRVVRHQGGGKKKKRGAGARMDCAGYSVTETNSLIRCKSAGAL